MRLTLGEVAAILETRCESPEWVVEGYSIDSRTVLGNQLFFAIRGPHFDGHDFVQEALDRGAIAAVVERKFEANAERPLAASLLPVPDTTMALQCLAHAVRNKWRGTLIAVTGSTGKTTTKELIAALLRERLVVHKSPHNLNNQYGVALTLLDLNEQHEVAVLELAMSAAGEIGRLARMAVPQFGVVTNVAPAHLEFFDSVDSIARAKRELIENLESPGTAILNYDDSRVRRFAEGFRGRVRTFGFQEGADLRAMDARPGVRGGSDFRVIGSGFADDFFLPLPGRHNIENALAALATASFFEIPTAALRNALTGLQNLHLRHEVLTLPGRITLLNDCYNSNPLAMERMLETIATWPNVRRRILVVGEMLELGSTSPELHRRVGNRCVEAGADWLLAVQGNARYILEGAIEAGLPKDKTRFFSTAEQAAEYCRVLLEADDLVLIKGSRGVRLEKVTELLGNTRIESSTRPA